MGDEKKVYSKVIKSGAQRIEVKEITKGRDAGKFQITGQLNGKFHRFGVRTTKEKALELARKNVVQEDLKRTRLDNLTDEQVDLVLAFLDSGLSLEDLQTMQDRTQKTEGATVGEVLAQWYKTKTEGHEYSKQYLRDCKYVVDNLTAHAGAATRFNTLDTHALEQWLGSLTKKGTKDAISPKRYKNLRGILVAVWTWASLKKNNYAAENFANDIEAPRILAKSGGHEVLTPQEFALLLENVDERCTPWLTISGFAGLRQSEICGAEGRKEDRLKWEDFDWKNKRICVRVETSKTRLPRFAPICDALAEWLKPWKNATGYVHRGQAPTWGPGKGKQSETARLGEFIGGWRSNCLRASRASYRLAETNNIGLTAMEDGHTEAMLRKNYLNPRFAEDAALWFSLTPQKVKELNRKRIVKLPSKRA